MTMYVTGKGGYNAICDVCGFKYKNTQLRKRWDGLMVCEADWENRHILDFYKPKLDEHPIPWSRPDRDLEASKRVFEPNYSPTEVVTLTSLTINYATRFTVNVDGYLNNINIFIGSLPDTGSQTSYGNIQYKFAIWDVAGASELWSYRYHVLPNRWVRLPITPNVRVTSGNDYQVSMFKFTGQPATYVQPAITAAPNTYFTHLDSRYSLSDSFPNTLDLTSTQLMDVTIRPD